MSQPKTWEFDVRIRERNLKKNLLDPKEFEKYLKDLPDVSAQADTVSVHQPGFAPADADDDAGED